MNKSGFLSESEEKGGMGGRKKTIGKGGRKRNEGEMILLKKKAGRLRGGGESANGKRKLLILVGEV